MFGKDQPEINNEEQVGDLVKSFEKKPTVEMVKNDVVRISEDFTDGTENQKGLS